MTKDGRLPLTVSGDAPFSLGPLSVEIIPENGEPIGFALTSNYREHTVDVTPGRCAVIARRPNQACFRQSVTVSAGMPVRVALAKDVPGSPNEFMWPETMRGEVTRVLRLDRLERSGMLNGFAAQTLKAITTARAPDEFVRLAAGQRAMRLRVWNLPEQEAAASVYADLDSEHASSFLKVRIESGCLAVGLVDRDGFGPIVMTPPFRKPLDISFLAEGVATCAAERYLNPSGQRAPVALATPTEPILADFLCAIGCPAMEHREAVWKHNVGGLADAESAVGCLNEQFACPAGVLLAAHYLLRFLPDRLSLRSVDHLTTAMPDVADGPVIGAWLRLLSRADDVKAIDPDIIDREVHDLLAEALARQGTLFRRTRRLLTKSLRLGSELHPLETSRRPALDAPGPARFLNYGAHAGGLEAFWGTDPFTPGPRTRDSTLPARDIANVTLRGTMFVCTTPPAPCFLAGRRPSSEEDMAQSTSQQRVAWKAYECETEKMEIIPFGPDRIRVAPPTVDAWRALESVLQYHDYRIRPSDTDSYNCRQITGGTGLSLHSYGIALDVNWTTNPYRRTPDKRKVRFSDKLTQAERAMDVKHDKADTDMTPQMISDVLAIKTRSGKRVFEWGGNWSNAKDTMHFELDVTPEDLASGIDWTSVKIPPGEVVPEVVAPTNGSTGAPGTATAAPVGIPLGSFEAVHPLVEKWEGGFSNHPSDPGGATNMGITRETLARWRGRPVSVEEVRQLTRDEARQIFQEYYWKPLRGDELPLPAALMAYNTGVLSGQERAVLTLQAALNRQGKPVALDGDIGPATIGASIAADQRRLVDDYAEIYEAYLRSLPTFATFGRGWLNRLTDVRVAARLAAELASIGQQVQADQGDAIRAQETTMTTDEMLRQILVAVNASRPAAPQPGDPAAPGRAALPPQPKAPPISTDLFGQILGSVIGRIIQQIGAQGQSQFRSQTATDPAAQAPGGSGPAVQPPVLPAAASEKAAQPVFLAAPTDMALGETIGSALAGRKTVLAMLAYAAAMGLKTYNPALGAAVDTILPLIYALGGWGVVGKVDKWMGALTRQAGEIPTAPAAVAVKPS